VNGICIGSRVGVTLSNEAERTVVREDVDDAVSSDGIFVEHKSDDVARDDRRGVNGADVNEGACHDLGFHGAGEDSVGREPGEARADEKKSEHDEHGNEEPRDKVNEFL